MSRCTCEFPAHCNGDGWLDCKLRAWGSCFCACGCTEDCYGCTECATREYDDDDDEAGAASASEPIRGDGEEA